MHRGDLVTVVGSPSDVAHRRQPRRRAHRHRDRRRSLRPRLPPGAGLELRPGGPPHRRHRPRGARCDRDPHPPRRLRSRRPAGLRARARRPRARRCAARSLRPAERPLRRLLPQPARARRADLLDRDRGRDAARPAAAAPPRRRRLHARLRRRAADHGPPARRARAHRAARVAAPACRQPDPAPVRHRPASGGHRHEGRRLVRPDRHVARRPSRSCSPERPSQRLW